MTKQMHSRIFRTAAMLLCSGGLMASAAMAQQDAPPPPDGQTQGPPPGGHDGRFGPERRLDMLTKHLNLSDDQKAQAKTILDAQRAKVEAVRSNTSLSEQDRRAQFRAIHQDEDVKFKAILTSDQKAKYDEMEARERDHMRPGGPGGPPPANPQQ
jgi:periplasmic protein CpxP/Spy